MYVYMRSLQKVSSCVSGKIEPWLVWLIGFSISL